MSAILSADDLNDFISPGVACIKPVETLPKQDPQKSENAYEVTTEDKVNPQTASPAQISLTDCLACSGCVTSAETVLISLQSHTEVLNALDTYPGLDPWLSPSHYVDTSTQTLDEGLGLLPDEGKLFIASVSPQVRASIAATYSITEVQAGNLITQLLSGPQGLALGGAHQNGFTWTIDTNAMREACLVLAADEVLSNHSLGTGAPNDQAGSFAATAPKKPVLTSACPGWICYAEKTHPHTIPHLSRLKSPQALTGTLLKTVLSQRLGIRPDQIWHLAVMPCFDKKLEASREELTDVYWRPPDPEGSDIPNSMHGGPVRDTDCVITARELVMLADTRGISLPSLPLTPLPHRRPFPDATLERFLFPSTTRPSVSFPQKGAEAGTSGGYLYHILCTILALHPGSTLHTSRGRNADVVDLAVLAPDSTPVFKAARYYGSRNITNLVRKLRPGGSRMPGGARKAASARGGGESGGGGIGLDYVEVMACPGGCTNGGGQIKATDTSSGKNISAKEWLAKVDEAYFSASEEDAPAPSSSSSSSNLEPEQAQERQGEGEREKTVPSTSPTQPRQILNHWSQSTGIPLPKLVCTSYRAVQSDVGKSAHNNRDQERVVELAGRIGGGW